MIPITGLTAAALFLAAGVLHTAPEPPASPSADAPRLLRRVPLTDPPTLASLQNRAFPGSLPGTPPIRVGSIFSGLFRDRRDPEGVFWGVMDRGPNGERVASGETRRTFVLPGYVPALVRVRVGPGPALFVESAIHLKGTDGRPVSGLPTRPGADETPYDALGETALPFRPGGVDCEAVVRAPNGDFWIAEEYGPSLLRVAPDGRVRTRYVPAGVRLGETGYPVAETLPAVLARRRQNRGFEGLAISRDGATLHAFLQSPLAQPDRATADASRLVRVLTVDAGTGRPRAEHVVVLDEASAYGETRQSEVRIGDAVRVSAGTLLVVEQTEPVARIYALDLSEATNILGSAWDDHSATPSLESLAPAALAARGIVPARRTLLVDLTALVPALPEKIEGLAIVDATTVVVGNENEYEIRGGFRPGSRPSELIFVGLRQPLTLE